MNRLKRDGTAEPVSRDQILTGANEDRQISIFPVQLTRILLNVMTIQDEHT